MRRYVLLVLLASCTRRNPAVCCVSEVDCEHIGLPVGSLCENGMACNDNACVPPECHTNVDCAASAPICRDGVCVTCDANTPCMASAPVCDIDRGMCGGCTDDAACAAFPTSSRCDTTSGSCVQCFTGAECSAAAPVCDSGTCRACKAHADCPSTACLPDGTCGDDTSVAYVSNTGTANSLCTKAMPCSAVSSGLATMRPYVKLAGSFDEQVRLDRAVTLLAAPGATLRNSGAGPAISVYEAFIHIYDLTIRDTNGVGVSSNSSIDSRVSLTRVTITGTAQAIDARSFLLLESSTIVSNAQA